MNKKQKTENIKKIVGFVNIGAIILCLLIGVLGGVRVRYEVRKLKQQNLHLNSLSIEKEKFVQTIESQNKELQDNNENLEQKIIERTATLRNIIDNVKTGFFIMDDSYRIVDGFTKSCESILHRTITSGSEVPQILMMNNRTADHFKLVAAQVFDDCLPEEISLDQLPERVITENRILRLEGSPTRNSENKITGILFTMSDITDFENANLENDRKSAILAILANKDSFIRLIAQTEEHIKKFWKDTTLINHDRQNQLRYFLHTLKGNLTSYKLFEIAQFIHDLEDKQFVNKLDLRQIESMLIEFLEKNGSILNLKYYQHDMTDTTNLTISEIEIGKLISISEFPQSEISESLKEWISRSKLRPISELLGPIQESFADLCMKLNKKVNLVTEGTSIRILPDTFSVVLQNLIHIIRNSVDHGIQIAPNGKTSEILGTVNLRFATEESKLIITVEDDGVGINPKKIAQKALETETITEAESQSMSEAQMIALIFQDDFSTADSVSDISGRGIGIGAFKAAVENANGAISVNSQLGRGTTIQAIIELKKNEWESTTPDVQLAS